MLAAEGCSSFEFEFEPEIWVDRLGVAGFNVILNSTKIT